LVYMGLQRPRYAAAYFYFHPIRFFRRSYPFANFLDADPQENEPVIWEKEFQTVWTHLPKIYGNTLRAHSRVVLSDRRRKATYTFKHPNDTVRLRVYGRNLSCFPRLGCDSLFFFFSIIVAAREPQVNCSAAIQVSLIPTTISDWPNRLFRSSHQ
jgi:hypothetical protein